MSQTFWNNIAKKIISFLLIFTINFVHLATPALVLAEELTSTPTPTANPSPQPSAEPTSTPSPSPSPDPSPTAEPSPTSAPTPQPSVSPNPTEEVTPTADATSSATPSASINPSTSTASSSAQVAVSKPGFKKSNTNKETKEYVEGEVIVKFKKDKVNLKSVIGQVKSSYFEHKNGLSESDEIEDLNIKVVKSNESTSQLIDKLKTDSAVEYVEPNYLRKLQAIPADADFNKQWGLHNTGQTVNGKSGINDADIDAPETWDLETSSQQDTMVAVIDSGINYSHPDLTANMWDGSSCEDENGNSISGGCPNHGWDFTSNDNDPQDDFGHGTNVAGIIAGVADANGVLGVSHSNNIKIMALKILNNEGFDEVSSDKIIKAINFAKNNGAKIINASLGGSNYSQAEKEAIDAFPGLFVAASGNRANNNDLAPSYPASYSSSNIISVAATNQNDQLASFSNYGSSSVDVGAPGDNIYNTYVSTNTEEMSENFNLGIPANYQNSGWAGLDGGVWSDPNTPYLANASNTLTSPLINMSGSAGASLEMYTLCDTEYNDPDSGDYLALEYSADGSNFSEFRRWNEKSIDSDTSPVSFTEKYLINSIPSQFLTGNFKFRLHWVTNSSDAGDLGLGCFIDDVRITKTSIGSSTYDYLSGTSMASPLVAGVAAMIDSYNTSLTLSQSKDIILNSGDSLPALAGKTVSGKRINLYNALVQAGSNTPQPSAAPTAQPSASPTTSPSAAPSASPTAAPSPTSAPSPTPPQNHPPVAGNLNITTAEDTAITFNVSITDEDNDPQTLIIVDAPSHGTLNYNANSATVTYTPNSNYNGPDSFTYKANDGQADSNTATVSITVNGSNDAPSVTSVSITPTNPGTNTVLTANVAASDPEGDNLTYQYQWKKNGQSITGASGQTLNLAGSGIGDKGDQISVSVTVSDAEFTSPALESNSVTILNSAPTVANSTDSVNEDQSLTMSKDLLVVNNGLDEDGDTLFFGQVNSVTNGVVNVTQSDIVFTPNANYNGGARLTYTLLDSDGASGTGTVNITVNPVNDVPVAGNVSVTTNEDTSKEIVLDASDVDGDSLVYTVTNIPSHGTLGTIADGKVTYTPASNYNGSDSFTYKASDGPADSNSNTATVSITINPVNDAPVAPNQQVETNEDSQVAFTLNVSDPDRQYPLYNIITPPQHGSLTYGENYQITYTPQANYNGPDTFTYQANDGPAFSDIATVTITVNPVNDAPVARNDNLATTKNETLTFEPTAITSNDTDVDQDTTISVKEVKNAVHGSVSMTEGNIVFVPEQDFVGQAGFTYVATDGAVDAEGYATVTVYGSLDSDQIIITPEVTVTPARPEIVLGNLSANSQITVPDTVSNATLNAGNLVSVSEGNRLATLPSNININSATSVGNITVGIPAGIIISAPSNEWTGIINLPAVQNPASVTVTPSQGTTAATTGVIEVGFGDVKLTFSKAVRLVLPGKANQLTGYSRAGTFTPISTVCSADSQAAGDSLNSEGDCKINSGSDLVVWTKHFTKFVTYTETAVQGGGGPGVSTSGGGGAGSSTEAPVCTDAKPGSAPTLLKAVAGENSVTLSWSKAADPVTYYLIAYGFDSGKMQFGNPNVGDKNTTSYTVKNLSGGVTYFFKVRAGNSCMPGEFSNEISAKPFGQVVNTAAAEGFQEGVLSTDTEEATQSADLRATESATPEYNKAYKKDNRWLIWLGVILGATALLIAYRKLKSNR